MGAPAFTAQRKAFDLAMRLPPPVMRRVAGRTRRIDGMTLSPAAQWMLRLQRIAREPVVETLPIPEGRDAVRRQSLLAGGDQPIGRTEEVTVPGADGEIPARLYVPRGLLQREGAVGGLVYFHGGAMIYGDRDAYDPVCRFLAEHAGVRVVSVDYRLAPEHVFPAAHDDACAAYEHVVRHASDFGLDPQRIAVGGDSAGGYLAAAVAIDAARRGVPVAFQLLIYPMTDMGADTESRRLFGRGLYLTTDFIRLGTESYMAGADLRDPRASVLHADLPDGLAPAYVATAGFDPLRDEGEQYAAKLADAGVPVQFRRYGAEIHGFANMVGFKGGPRDAMLRMASVLNTAVSS